MTGRACDSGFTASLVGEQVEERSGCDFETAETNQGVGNAVAKRGPGLRLAVWLARHDPREFVARELERCGDSGSAPGDFGERCADCRFNSLVCSPTVRAPIRPRMRVARSPILATPPAVLRAVFRVRPTLAFSSAKRMRAISARLVLGRQTGSCPRA